MDIYTALKINPRQDTKRSTQTQFLLTVLSHTTKQASPLLGAKQLEEMRFVPEAEAERWRRLPLRVRLFLSLSGALTVQSHIYDS